MKDHVINLFDFVAICCKFLDETSLRQVLQKRIELDKESGNL